MQGIPVSPGIAIGKAHIWKFKEIKPDKRIIKESEIKNELDLFQYARNKIIEELKSASKDLPPEVSKFIESQIYILSDKDFLTDVNYNIKVKKRTAEYSTFKVLDDMSNKFSKSSIEYMRERGRELLRLFNDFMRFYRKEHKRTVLKEEEVIVFADEISLEEAIRIANSNTRGLVLKGGGRTSHAAIVLRNSKVPAVFGVGDFKAKVNDEEIIILNGWKGEVLIRPTKVTIERFENLRKRYEKQDRGLSNIKDIPAVSKDNKEITLMANLDLPSEIDLVTAVGASGIGLFRTELLFYQYSLEEDAQADIYRRICHSVYPFPCIIRAFDLGGDKVIDGYSERNPFLGLRGIRLLLKNEQIFRRQMRAVFKANSEGNIKYMLPMITSKWEIERAREIFFEEFKKLRKSKELKRPDFGIMVEVPSIALTLDNLNGLIDFVSIGTNDLTQYTLAVDRKNTNVSYLYNHLHPAVLKLIRDTVQSSRGQHVQVGVCGEMASDPLGISILMGLGITEFSLTPSLILEMKSLIKSLCFEDLIQVAQRVLEFSNSEEVRAFVSKFLNEKAPYIMERYGRN